MIIFNINFLYLLFISSFNNYILNKNNKHISNMIDTKLRTLKDNQKRIFIIPSLDKKLKTFPDYEPKLDIKYKLFIHNILYQQTYKKLEFTDYVCINRETMIKELGNDPIAYTRIRSFFINNKIFDVFKNKKGKESYWSKVKSKQYKINESYNEKISTVIVEDKFLERLYKRKQKTLKTELEKDDDAKRMYIQFKYLRIKADKALRYLSRKRKKYNLNDFTDLQYKHQLLFINNFNSITETFFTWKNVGKRHYTQLTNLNKEYRKFLYFDSELHSKDYNLEEVKNNQKLVNLDIKNSQPILLNVLIDRFNKENELETYLKDVLNNKNKINYNIYTYVVGFSQLNPLRLHTCYRKELQFYKELTEGGIFYDYLMNKYKVKDRRKFKLDFFRDVLFGKLQKPYITELEKIFLSEFPLIFMVINYYKLEDYRNLAIQLQNLESDMIIRTVCKRINEEYPQILLSTIHDSIVCQEEFVWLVREVLQDEFKKINLKIKINYEL
jgi:hypothetical protein